MPFELSVEDLQARLPAVLRVLYLIFNEGYASSSGRELQRAELSQEAIRLARLLHRALPDEPEAASLLALMLLIDARRPARTDASGDLYRSRSRTERSGIARSSPRAPPCSTRPRAKGRRASTGSRLRSPRSTTTP